MEYLRTVADAHIDPSETPPPLAPLQELADLGVAVVSRERYRESMEKHAYRRRILKGLVEGHGWEWSQLSLAHSSN